VERPVHSHHRLDAVTCAELLVGRVVRSALIPTELHADTLARSRRERLHVGPHIAGVHTRVVHDLGPRLLRALLERRLHPYPGAPPRWTASSLSPHARRSCPWSAPPARAPGTPCPPLPGRRSRNRWRTYRQGCPVPPPCSGVCASGSLCRWTPTADPPRTPHV